MLSSNFTLRVRHGSHRSRGDHWRGRLGRWRCCCGVEYGWLPNYYGNPLRFWNILVSWWRGVVAMKLHFGARVPENWHIALDWNGGDRAHDLLVDLSHLRRYVNNCGGPLAMELLRGVGLVRLLSDFLQGPGDDRQRQEILADTDTRPTPAVADPQCGGEVLLLYLNDSAAEDKLALGEEP
mmetsp:Transcript_14489/g.29238  ORF Transcript_14489/g.29238 Transcript_14489/m.29238 type:complete len:181 (+) Transcript_14489:364-906(+)